MISGIEFYKKCNWNLCSRYQINYNPELIKEGDFIFINLDSFYHFVDMIKNNHTTCIFNLVTHNSDLTFNQQMFDLIEPFINKVYCINCEVNNDKVVKIPLGFSDRLLSIISSMKSDVEKDNLLYVNFNIHSGRIKERVECRNHFTQYDWIKFEDLVPENQYYKTLSESKYCACPIGAGLDTHRFYESIYFNTIPIVKRNSISDLHQKFPCIVVDDWSEVKYEMLLNDYELNYKNLINWKKQNNWSDINFWLK